MSTQNQASLYERLGGVYNIATVVEDFIDRIMVDPRLNANPRVDEAHHRVSPARCSSTLSPRWSAGRPGASDIHWPFHARLSPRSDDHCRRVGGVSR
jgi:truncated hemoglobin YjbI